jgi:D-sedoheptulose 7-phosphate isomerase
MGGGMSIVEESVARLPKQSVSAFRVKLENRLDCLERILKNIDLMGRFDEICFLIANSVTCPKQKTKLLLCGNGGSASQAQHIAAEFVCRFKDDREALPAIALTTDAPILTAVSNDYSYENIFSRQLEALGWNGDILIILSTSGNSPNCIRAAKTAKDRRIITIGFTNQDGGKLRELVDFWIGVPEKNTAIVQEMHLILLHLLCEYVDEFIRKEENK